MTSTILNFQTELPDPAALNQETSQIARHMLSTLDEVIRDTNVAVLAALPYLAASPATIRASTQGTEELVSQFLNSLARHPSDRPPFKSNTVVLEKAQFAVAAGATNRELSFGYQSAKSAIGVLWRKAARELERDPASLPALIARGSDLLNAYVDEAFAAVRARLTTPGLANSDRVIGSILAGEPIDLRGASGTLGYPFAARHTALILWSPGTPAPPRVAKSVSRRLATSLSSSAVHYSIDTRTEAIWLAPTKLMDFGRLRETLAADETLEHVAVGSEQPGAAGFRATFATAKAAYEFARSNPTERTITVHADIEVAAIATTDILAARNLVGSTLGSLSMDATEARVLRETLLIFLEEGENAPRAGARLFTHRNTVLYRVGRAKAAIGGRFEERRLAIFLALELARRLGSVVLTSPGSRPERRAGTG
jgi:hypothetical protein